MRACRTSAPFWIWIRATGSFPEENPDQSARWPNAEQTIHMDHLPTGFSEYSIPHFIDKMDLLNARTPELPQNPHQLIVSRFPIRA